MESEKRNVLLAGVVGSTAYGLAHEGSDVDRLGVYAAPTERLLGLTDPPWSIVSVNPDLTMHEAKKWCKLALGCNPTAMELVWLEGYEAITEHGANLIKIRQSFLSARAVRNAYLGYATQQLTKIKNRREAGMEFTPLTESSRLLSEKNARHLYRLLLQGCDLHQTGELMIRLNNPEEVRRTGEAIAAVPSEGDRLIAWAEGIFNGPGVLPEKPRRDVVEAWLLRVRRAYL